MCLYCMYIYIICIYTCMLMFRVVVFISLSVAFLILFYSLYKLITRCAAIGPHRQNT